MYLCKKIIFKKRERERGEGAHLKNISHEKSLYYKNLGKITDFVILKINVFRGGKCHLFMDMDHNYAHQNKYIIS